MTSAAALPESDGLPAVPPRRRRASSAPARSRSRNGSANSAQTALNGAETLSGAPLWGVSHTPRAGHYASGASGINEVTRGEV